MANNKSTVVTCFRFRTKEDELASLNRITGLNFSSMPESLVNGETTPIQDDDSVLLWAANG